MFFTVTLLPLAVSMPFQSWEMVCPLANVHRTVHPLIATDPAVTVTSAWKPGTHWFMILYEAEQAPVVAGALVVDGGRLVLGAAEVVGGRLVVGAAEVVGGRLVVGAAE